MGFSAALLLIKGDHREAMPAIFESFGYQTAGTPQPVPSWNDALTRLHQREESQTFVKKAVTMHNGWTVVFDPEMAMPANRAACRGLAQSQAAPILGCIWQSTSGSFGFWLFDGSHERAYLSVDGQVVESVGAQLPVESARAETDDAEALVFSVLSQVAFPYEELEAAGSVDIYALGEHGGAPRSVSSPRSSAQPVPTKPKRRTNYSILPGIGFLLVAVSMSVPRLLFRVANGLSSSLLRQVVTILGDILLGGFFIGLGLVPIGWMRNRRWRSEAKGTKGASAADRSRMIEALQEVLVPRLRELGFSGRFPHFRRPGDKQIDLLTFQFDRHGGGFVVEIAACPAEGVTMRWGEHVPSDRVTAHHIDPFDRLRLGSSGSGKHHWFRYDGAFRGSYRSVAGEVVRLLDDRAEGWWRDRSQQD